MHMYSNIYHLLTFNYLSNNFLNRWLLDLKFGSQVRHISKILSFETDVSSVLQSMELQFTLFNKIFIINQP